jgi:Skp family chaperone for outer membrane proteins
MTPVHTTERIALLDHARLRKEYKGLRLVADSMQHEWAVLKNKEDRIKQNNMDSAKKQALLDACENEKKQLLQKRGALIQQYESKITEAIAKVVGEGGFTDVQPMYKDKPAPNGTDITDKVLNKLN